MVFIIKKSAFSFYKNNTVMLTYFIFINIKVYTNFMMRVFTYGNHFRSLLFPKAYAVNSLASQQRPTTSFQFYLTGPQHLQVKKWSLFATALSLQMVHWSVDANPLLCRCSLRWSWLVCTKNRDVDSFLGICLTFLV